MPACGEIHKAMQEVTDLSDTGKGAVHKDLTPARIKRDTKDLTSVLDFVANRTPFACNTKELQSLSSGIIGKGPVDVDTAKTIGESILASMEGQSVQQHTFSKKAQVNSLASVVYVAVDGGKLQLSLSNCINAFLSMVSKVSNCRLCLSMSSAPIHHHSSTLSC